MFITIDRTNLRVMRKHPNQRTLSWLAYIEAADVAVVICSAYGSSFLHGFTDLEKKKLYCNITGESTCLWAGDHAHAVLMELVSRLPEDIINPIEVLAQANHISMSDDERYRFVPGKTRPALVEDLFEFAYPKATRNSDEIKVASYSKSITEHLYPGKEAEDRMRAIATAEAVAVTSAPAPTRSRPAGAPSAPRSGGVREKVWSVADAMWTEAGRPTDPKMVLALRKKIMDELEAKHEVKRTSSSNELGNWQKTRI